MRLPDGAQAPALAPFVSLLNHSPWPHVVRFSKVDAATGCLDLRLLRPIAAGDECCLSYGPLPNEHLLLFYGFVVAGNPADSFQLSLPVSSQPGGGGEQQAGALRRLEQQRAAALKARRLDCSALLRPAWRARQLPQLLPAARLAAASAEQLRGDKQAVTGADDAAAAALLEALAARAAQPCTEALQRVRAAQQQPASGEPGDGGDFSAAERAAFLTHLEVLLAGAVELLTGAAPASG